MTLYITCNQCKKQVYFGGMLPSRINSCVQHGFLHQLGLYCKNNHEGEKMIPFLQWTPLPASHVPDLRSKLSQSAFIQVLRLTLGKERHSFVLRWNKILFILPVSYPFLGLPLSHKECIIYIPENKKPNAVRADLWYLWFSEEERKEKGGFIWMCITEDSRIGPVRRRLIK